MNPAKRKPVGEYLKPQGRFRGLKPETEAAIQAETDARWALLLKRHARGV